MWLALAFTTNQVLAVLSSLDVNKSSGPDEIPARILRETTHKIAPSLCDLFNKSLRLVSLLTEWKLANIVLVYKKDNKEYVENYRPISLLCIVSKVMWSIVCLLLLRIKYIAWSAAAVTRLHGKAFMCYAFGRGVWPYWFPVAQGGISGHYLFRYV